MSHGGLQAIEVWTQVPVASRTVEVNTKTGFSLTAGSYSVRASSNQRGTISLTAGLTTAPATISSVTTTRAQCLPAGTAFDNVSTSDQYKLATIVLTNATTVTATRITAGDILTCGYEVQELF